MCNDKDHPPQVIHLTNTDNSPPPPPPRPRTSSPPPKLPPKEIPIVKNTEHVHYHWHECLPATHHHSFVYYDYVEPLVTKRWHKSVRELTYDFHDDWRINHNCWTTPRHHWYPSYHYNRHLSHHYDTLFFDDHFNSHRHHFRSHYLC